MMDIDGFFDGLKQQTGYDFCNYSRQSITRRIQKICEENSLATLEDLLKKAVADKPFLMRMVEDITVNTTELFRDPTVWISLYKTLYQQLPKQKVNFWHLGCSVGLETYSNIILLNELGALDRVRVIGTDLNPRVLMVARKGEYANKFNMHFRDNFDEVMKGIGSKSHFEDYFDTDEANDRIAMKEKFTKVPQFLGQNMVQDQPPFPYKIDVVFIRNVMIYFNAQLQTKIIQMIQRKMFDNACIILGKQELLPDSVKSLYQQAGHYYKRVQMNIED